MSTIGQPNGANIRELTRAESEAVLSRNNVGRLAFAFQDQVDIEPLNYIYKHNWIYGRTSAGSKLDTIARHRLVAFEVDEVAAMFDWRSVVVKGAFEVVEPSSVPKPDPGDTSARENPGYAQAVALLRELVPDTLLSADPAPLRTFVFRIPLSVINGREATPRR